MARSGGDHHSTLTMKSVPDVPPVVTGFRPPLTLFFSLTRGGAKAPTLQTSCQSALKNGDPLFRIDRGCHPVGAGGGFHTGSEGDTLRLREYPILPWGSGDPSVVNDFGSTPRRGVRSQRLHISPSFTKGVSGTRRATNGRGF
jgi:hypothetical protein